jgi:hypothetical protein
MSTNLLSLASEIRRTVRSLLRHSTFTTAAVLTLALGIGATTAIFSVAAPRSMYASVGPGPVRGGLLTTTYVVRSEREGTESLANENRQAVWASSPDLTVYELRTLQQHYTDSLARTSFIVGGPSVLTSRGRDAAARIRDALRMVGSTAGKPRPRGSMG